MSAKNIIINTDLNTVLKNKSFDNFTVRHLRDEYLKTSSDKRDFVEARKFVYRQILRLVRLGVLKKATARNPKESRYNKTSTFFSTQFKSHLVQLNKVSEPVASKKIIYDINSIEERLKKYQVDLLACVGESEEYMRLYKTNPEFKLLLETEYLQARDQSSKLLGQIKALETVIKHYS